MNSTFSELDGDEFRMTCEGDAQFRFAGQSVATPYTGPIQVPADVSTVTALCDGRAVVHARLPLETADWSHRDLLARAHSHTGPRPAIDVNVVVVLLDAVSRAHFRRSMPAVQAVLARANRTTSALFDFERFHAVGSASAATQPPLLVGHACAAESAGADELYDRARHRAAVTAENYLPELARTYGYVRGSFSDQCQHGLQFAGLSPLFVVVAVQSVS
jgi:hypothetical protein